MSARWNRKIRAGEAAFKLGHKIACAIRTDVLSCGKLFRSQNAGTGSNRVLGRKQPRRSSGAPLAERGAPLAKRVRYSMQLAAQRPRTTNSNV